MADDIYDPNLASQLMADEGAGTTPEDLTYAEANGYPVMPKVPKTSQAVAEMSPVAWSRLAETSPALATKLLKYRVAGIAKPEADSLANVADSLNRMKAREQLPWGTALKNWTIQAASQGASWLASVPYAVEATGNAALNSAFGTNYATGADTIFGNLTLSLVDAERQAKENIAPYRQTFAQQYVAAPTIQMVANPLPLVASAASGGAATPFVAGALRIGAQAAVTRAVSHVETLTGAALVNNEVAAGMRLGELMQQKQERGEALNLTAGDAADILLTGLASQVGTKLGGLTAELGWVGAKGRPMAEAALGNLVREPLSEGLESAAQQIIADVHETGSVNVQQATAAGLQGFFGGAIFGAATLPLASRMGDHMDDAAEAARSVAQSADAAKVVVALNQSAMFKATHRAPEFQRDIINSTLSDEQRTSRISEEVWAQQYGDKANTLADSLGAKREDGDLVFDTATILQHGLSTSSKSFMEFYVENARMGDQPFSNAEGRAVLPEAVKGIGQTLDQIREELKAPRLPSGALDNSATLETRLTADFLAESQRTKMGHVVSRPEEAKANARLATAMYRTTAEMLNRSLGEARYTPEDVFTEFPLTVGPRGQLENVGTGAGRAGYHFATGAILGSKGADSSSFPHEMAHHYLAMSDYYSEKSPILAADQNILRSWWSENAQHMIDTFPPDQTKRRAEIDKLGGAEWLKGEMLKPMNDMHPAAFTAAHEYFARGFEKYLLEGKAPTPSMKKLFSRFASWLKTVYAAVVGGPEGGTRVNLSDDVRKVYDRVLAIDQEVEAELARQPSAMFTTKPEGMSDAVWESLLRVTQAKREEVVSKELEAAIEETRKNLNASPLDDTRAQEEVQQVPAYKAWTEIINTDPEQGPVAGKFDSATAEGTFGKDNANWMQEHGLLGEGGMLGDDFARSHGFATAEDLILRMRRIPTLDQAVKAMAEEHLRESYGGRTDRQIAEEIVDAELDSTYRTRLAVAEMKAIESMGKTGLVTKAQVSEAVAAAVAVEEERLLQMKEEAKSKLDQKIADLKADKSLTVEALKLKMDAAEADAKAKLDLETEALKLKLKNEREAASADARAAKETASALNEQQTIVEAKVLEIQALNEVLSWKPSELNPGRLNQKASSLHRAAIRALAAGDYAKAVTHRRAEALTREMARQAERLKGELATAVKDIHTLRTNRKRRDKIAQGSPWTVKDVLGNVKSYPTYDGAKAAADAINKASPHLAVVPQHDNAFLTMIDLIASRYGDESVPPPNMTIDDMVKAVGLTPPDYFPHSVRATVVGGKPGEDLSVNDTFELHDTLLSLEHAAKNANSIFLKDRKETLEAVSGMLSAQVRSTKKTAIAKDALFGKMREGIQFAVTGMQTLSTMVNKLDGNNPNGVFADYFYNPTKRAVNYMTKLTDDYFGPLNMMRDELKAHWKEAKVKPDARVRIDGVKRPISREEAIMVALYDGSVTGHQRLTGDDMVNAFTPDEVNAIKASLTAQEIAFVNQKHALEETVWNKIVADSRKRGEPVPAKVEAVPSVLPNGTLTGGYTPIAYIEARMASEDPAVALANGRQRLHMGSDSFRESRANVAAHLTLDLSPEAQITAARTRLKSLAYSGVWQEQRRLLEKIRPDIIAQHGQSAFKNFHDALLGSYTGPKPADSFIEKTLRYTRTNMSNAILAGNLFSAVSQVTGYANAAADPRVAPRLASAMARFTVSPREVSAFVLDKSDMMKQRMEVNGQEMKDAMAALDAIPFGKWIDKYGYFGQRIMQGLVDKPTWLAAYDTAKKAGRDEQTAIDIADRAVTDTQSGGRDMDLPPAIRNEVARFIFMFGTYKVAVLNSIMRSKMRNSFKSPKDLAAFTTQVTLAAVIPAVGYQALAALLKNGQFGPDDDEWTKWVIKQGLAEGLGMIPVASAAASGITGIPASNLATRPLAEAGKAVGKTIDAAFAGDSEKLPTLKSMWHIGQILPGSSTFFNEQFLRMWEGYQFVQEHPTSPLPLVFGPPPPNKR